MQCQSDTAVEQGHLTGQVEHVVDRTGRNLVYVSSSPHDRGRSAAVRTLKVPCTIDKAGLFALADKGKADASTVRTVKCRTVWKGASGT